MRGASEGGPPAFGADAGGDADADADADAGVSADGVEDAAEAATRGADGSSDAPMPFPIRVPFVEDVGFTLHRFDGGVAELRLDVGARHLNSWDVAHGGVQMTMLDVAMAMAARSDDGDRTSFATIEMKTTFMRPAQHALRAVGRLRHRSATMAFCDAELFDARGRLCAAATGTFKAVRGTPARPARAAAPGPQPSDEETTR